MNAHLFVERRRPRAVQTDLSLVLVFWFSLAGLLLWALPFDAERRDLSHGVMPAVVTAFGAMTVLSGGAMFLSLRRQRLFDRRRARSPFALSARGT